MQQILTDGSVCTGFAGDGWQVLIADGDPLDYVPPADGEQLVVLDPATTPAGLRRMVEAGRQVVVVLPERAFDRGLALASALASA